MLSLLAPLTLLRSENVDLKRNSKLSKMGLFYFSLYFYYELCHYRSTKNAYWVYFCFTCSEQCIKIISSRKKCGLFSLSFKKIIPNNTIPTFQKVGGET